MNDNNSPILNGNGSNNNQEPVNQNTNNQPKQEILSEKVDFSEKNDKPVVQSESNVVSETVIDTDANTVVEEKKDEMKIEEVSVVVDSNDFNTLKESEVSANSVFNKKTEEATGTGMKEGVTYSNEKKKFPFFMVLMLIVLIVCAFFIDDITKFIEDYKEKNQQEEQTPSSEEPKEENKVITLEQIKEKLDSSVNMAAFENENKVKVDVSATDNQLIFVTTNYLQPNSKDNLVVEYTLENNVLTTICTASNDEFGLAMSIILIKEVALLQNVNTANLTNFINDNLYTMTIDKGFELTHSEDGNNTYKIALDKVLEIS